MNYVVNFRVTQLASSMPMTMKSSAVSTAYLSEVYDLNVCNGLNVLNRPLSELSVHPAVDVDLVTFVLRDVERIAVGVEATVLGHGTTARPLADAAFGK